MCFCCVLNPTVPASEAGCGGSAGRPHRDLGGNFDGEPEFLGNWSVGICRSLGSMGLFGERQCLLLA